ARRPRPALGMHASLAGEHAPLLAVARSAGGDDVLPHRLAAATSRDHVVDGQPRLRRAAVLTRPRIAREHRLAGDLAPMDVAGDADVGDEADHDRPLESHALGVELALAALDDLGLRLQDQHGRPADRAHVDRLVGRVEDEDSARSWDATT